MKCPLKRCIFIRFLGFFWPDINSKKFKNITFRLNSTRAIDWCINSHICLRKNLLNFHYKGGPLPKKKSNIFSYPSERSFGIATLKAYRTAKVNKLSSMKKLMFLIILKAKDNFANYFLQNELLKVAFGWVLTVLYSRESVFYQNY